MFRDFDVFDEYGDFIGRFNVAPDCLTSIGMVLALTVIYVAYAYIRLLVEGVIALFKTDWLEALKSFIAFGVITLLFVGALNILHAPIEMVLLILAVSILLYAGISAWTGIFALLDGDWEYALICFIPTLIISLVVEILSFWLK